jgi:hypothetical protein
MALGPRDTRDLVVLTGVDPSVLANTALRDGTTFAQVVAMMNAGLAALGGELANGLLAEIGSFTDEATVEYRAGSSNGMERHTEYGRPDSRRADIAGHMLPLIGWDRMLGWTWDYLRDARMPQIRADIADGLQDVRDRYRLSALTRLLKRGDDSGAANGLGTTGYSPGFATAAASTAVDFTPPSFEGNTFTSDHEHYVGIAGGAFTLAVFQDAAAELREHGHLPPYDAWIGGSDEAAVTALSGFAPVADALVTLGSGTAQANIDAMTYIGALEGFRVRVVSGIPQYYGVFFKSYGRNSPRNPLAIRLREGLNGPRVEAFPDPRSGAGPVYPLQNLMLFTEFGVGVRDRTAATIRYVNNTTWADGTAT